MATVSEVFDAVAPELASRRKDTFLELAAARLTYATWGTAYIQAVAYLAAHMLTLAPSTGEGADASGPVTSRGAGDLSIGYGQVSPAVVPTSDASLLTTRYGREFLALRSTRSASAARVISVGT